MAFLNSSQLCVPVFAGQGTAASTTPQTRRLAANDATTSSGAVILSACFEAFHSELSTLSPDELTQCDIDLNDFKTSDSLIQVPTDRYLHNPIISGPALFLIQSLRYISFIKALGISIDSLTPFSDVLRRNSDYDMGILGFSSGILPACVVGTSLSTVTYISRAVEAYRLALWIGIRSQQYRRTALNASRLGTRSPLPWSIVFVGMGKRAAQECIASFSKGDAPAVYITAVLDDTCVTISGRPDILEQFASFVSGSFATHKTALDALYHSPIHASTTRRQILADVVRRNIAFPNFSDIIVPIRSTLTGKPLSKEIVSGSLVELVVDMVITEPVNWDSVISELVQALPAHASVCLLNMGPGAGLIRSMERSFPSGRISHIDISLPSEEPDKVKPKQEPIAIVGMAVNMPGARNTSQLWEVLEKGINTITEVPEHRFKVSDYNSPSDPAAKRHMKAHTGNFIDGADEFDNKFFKISPREAKSMDPQQRVLLHTAYEALENSGYVPGATLTSNPDTFGCYIGAATHDYLQNLRDEIDVYYSTGTLKAFLSGRISYAMQLTGPSVVVDTACSSSSVAIYQGCRALMNGDCNAALVGGVNVITSPDMMLGLDRGHFLSPTGQCKAFDASADGYSRSEGCGMFVIKRLTDAVAENDNILGIIRGIELNQSGLAHSITHPHAPTQATLFKQVLANTGIDANRINVVEAHGTGTQAGDPTELESIRSIFAVNRAPSNPLHITSVKANIGHLEAASGAAGLAKLLLMLRHHTIPPQISLRNLNPRIAPLEADHTIINTEITAWVPSHAVMPRVAMLNNFGAAGSNAVMILEEFAPSPSKGSISKGTPLVFGVSAKTEAALCELRTKYLQWLQDPENEIISISDIAYTTTARRQVYSHRLSVTANDRDELTDKLAKASIMKAPDSMQQIVFIFSGQGSQYLRMGKSLYFTSAAFKKHIDECHSFLIASGFPGILSIITAGDEGSGLSVSEEFEAYQAAIFSLEYALAQLWISWGLTPSAVVGHSLGEYAALVIANVLNLEGALTLVANRVRFMVQKCSLESSGMLAVNMGSALIEEILRSSKKFSALSISCYNSPTDCVISGPRSQLKAFKAHLDVEVHCKNVMLAVPFGYHSPAMNPILEDLTIVAQRVTLHPPSIPIISNALGEVVMPGDATAFDAGYFARHCAEPVQFENGVRAFTLQRYFAQATIWIEIGPHTSSLPMLKSNPALPKNTMFLGSLRKQHDPWATLATSLSLLYTSGANLHWRQVFAHLPSVSCVDLPSYPLAKTKFWIPFKEGTSFTSVSDAEPQVTLATQYSMLHAWAQFPSTSNGCVAIFETPISELAGSIRGHNVGGLPLCPASIYLEQALAGIGLAEGHLGVHIDSKNIILENISFDKPLVYDESVSRTVVTRITLDAGHGAFTISSRVESSVEEWDHVRGEYHIQSTEEIASNFSRSLPLVVRQMDAVIQVNTEHTAETFSTRTAYEVIFPRVVDYGKEYHTMQSLTVDSTGMEGYAIAKLPNDYDRGKFVVHPVFMDTLLHVAGFVANLKGDWNDAYICSEVGSVKVIPAAIDNDASYSIYCRNVWLPEEGVMLAEAYAVQISEPRRIVAHLKNMHFRRVRLSSLKKGLARAAGIMPTSSTIRMSRAAKAVTYTSQELESTGGYIEPAVLKVVSETCDICASAIDVNTELATLGVDSLMSIEIFSKLEVMFPEANLNSQALSHCRSVTEIIQELTSKVDKSQTSSSSYSHSQSVSPASSPRTLVPDDKLPEPSTLVIDGEPDVKQVLANVLDINVRDIDDEADFESLGLDSLTSIETLYALKAEFGISLPSDFFTTYSTIRTVQSYFLTRLHSNFKISDRYSTDLRPMEPQVTLKTKTMDVQTNISRIAHALRLDEVPISIQSDETPGRLPLFLVHDGSGLVNYYAQLPPLRRTVWGIHNPHFITGEPWDNITHMALAYAEYIVSTTQGPVLLGGWSFGGVVAYEVALQLAKKGIIVQGILLIDSPSPINHVPLSNKLIDAVVKLNDRSATSDLGRLVKTQFEFNSRLLGRYDPYATAGDCPPLVLLRSVVGYKSPNVQPQDVPSWLADRSNRDLASVGWNELTHQNIQVMDIPGNHFEPFHPKNIEKVFRCMVEGCEYLESL